MGDRGLCSYRFVPVISLSLRSSSLLRARCSVKRYLPAFGMNNHASNILTRTTLLMGSVLRKESTMMLYRVSQRCTVGKGHD